MLGSWNVNVTVEKLPEKVATALTNVNETLIGSEYKSIAYLGSQEVNGINHAVLAEQTVFVGKDSKHIVLMIFHEKGMECNLINIERVLESGSSIGGITVESKIMDRDDGSKEAEIFCDAFKGFVGAKITPFAYLGKQNVSGENYFFVAEYDPMVLDGEKIVVLIMINDSNNRIQFNDILKGNIQLNAINTEKTNLRISAPWTIFYHKVFALFKNDKEITVLYNFEEPELKIWVKGNDSKASALSRFIPSVKTFGNVDLNISVVGDDGQSVPDINCTDEEAIEIAFRNNGAVSFTKHIETMFGDKITYVVFKKEVIQFFADNMTDIYGAISTLYQDIAKDVFEESLSTSGKCFFCTDAENSKLGYAFTWMTNPNMSLGKPLGEWP